jgi:hypothetical protein
METQQQKGLESLLQMLVDISESNRHFVGRVMAEPIQKLEIIKSFDAKDPNESAVIQQIVDLLEPLKTTNTHLQKVKDEILSLSKSGHEIDSPEKEAEWQVKLDEARKLDEAEALKIRNERSIDLPGVVQSVKGTPASDELDPATPISKLKGIGEVSASKLIAVGVSTVGSFKALSFDQKVKIIGPIVADRFK